MKVLMKSKIKFLFSLSLFFIALTGFVFTSCENSIHNDSETEKETAAEETAESKNPESGLIKIVVDNFQNDTRTVLPDIDTANIVSLSLSGTQGSNTKSLGSWTSLTAMTSDSIELKTGSWSLTLTALLNNGVTFTATTPVTVTGTGTQTVNFSLSTTATKGGVYLKVSYTGTAQAATYQLYQWSDGVQGASINSGDLTLNTTDHEVVYERPATGSTALASGNYRIKINFWGDDIKTVLLNSYSEIIRINGGYTSKAADRQIELNSMYTITYMNGGTTPATLAGTPASSLVEKYSARSSAITLPDMVREGYVFDGWYTTSACTGTALSTFAITSSTSLGPKTFYAKYRKICDLTYIISSSEDAEINLADLTAAQKTTYGIPDLPATHTEGETTDLPVLSFTDGVSASSPELFDGYHYTTLTGSTGPTLTGSGTSQKYVIGASDLSDNTTIYIKVNPINSYVDPNAESDTVLAFNVSTPAKSVSAAKGWLKDADSTQNPVLYAKGTLNTAADINALTNLTTTTYGNAIYKRHSSQNGSPLFILNGITATIQNLTIDGGAVWQDILTGNALVATSNVSSGTNAGLQADQPIILITGSGATLNMSSVHVQNCDGHTSSNNCKNIYVASGCVLDISNSSIIRCKSDMGGAIWTAGKIIANSLTMSYNYSLTNGGAAYIGDSSTVNVKFQNSTFDSNCAGSKGGAIYNTAVSNNNVLLVNDTFMGNTSSFANGTNIYNAGKLKLSGQMILIDGDIYVENTNTSTQYPIIFASDFSANGPASALPMTIKPAYYYSGPESAKVYDRKVFDFSEFSTNTTLINTILGYFELEDDAYQINTSGVISQIAGSINITPGLPENYVCKWTQTISGGTRQINIIIQDRNGGSVSPATGSLYIGVYEGPDEVMHSTTTSFNYPSYLDPPSGTPFYVKFNIQADDNTAYSYDYWPREGAIALGSGLMSVPVITTTANISYVFNGRSLKFPMGNRAKLIASDHEVTQSEYVTLMGENPSGFQGASNPPADGEVQNNRPVEKVSFYDAIMYCNLLSEQQNLTSCYKVDGDSDTSQWGYTPHEGASISGTITCDFDADGWRLPTEAEWEYLARGGDLATTGNAWSGTADENKIDEYAWTTSNSTEKTHEVKKKKPNFYGLYDMSGNVYEWCWDWYNSEITASTPADGGDGDTYRSIRGGCWKHLASDYYVSKRRPNMPNGQVNYLGFRVVRSSD